MRSGNTPAARSALRAGLVLALCLVVAACARPRDTAQLDGRSMGTTWRVSVPADRATPALHRDIEDELARLTAGMSAWEPDSALSRINRSAGDWQPLPDDLFHVLDYAFTLAAETGGAYDPSVGPLAQLWGFGPDGLRRDTPPSGDEIAAATARIGWRKFEFDRSARRIRQPGGLQLDINSLGPGYAVDRLAALLREAGIDGFLVELGGELRAVGRKPDGSDWRVAVERPDQADATAPDFDLVVVLRDAALGSSGDYRSGFVHEGRRYSHTLDPRHGEPVQHALAAVTVLADEAMHADALAAALMVLGPDEGWRFAQQRGIAAAFTVRNDDGSYTRRLTPGFAAARAP